jgi:hypothetical protein
MWTREVPTPLERRMVAGASVIFRRDFNQPGLSMTAIKAGVEQGDGELHDLLIDMSQTVALIEQRLKRLAGDHRRLQREHNSLDRMVMVLAERRRREGRRA